MIDPNGKIFGKISVIDFLIVAVIIAGLIWFFGIRGGGGVPAAGSEQTLILTYMTEAVPGFAADAINVGDKLEDFIKGGDIGRITSLTIDQGFDLRAARDGTFKISPKEGYSYVEFVCEVKGQRSENGVIINGNNYLVGQYVTMRAGAGKLYIMLRGISVAE